MTPGEPREGEADILLWAHFHPWATLDVSNACDPAACWVLGPGDSKCVCVRARAYKRDSDTKEPLLGPCL